MFASKLRVARDFPIESSARATHRPACTKFHQPIAIHRGIAAAVEEQPRPARQEGLHNTLANNKPGSIGSLPITSIMVIAVATGRGWPCAAIAAPVAPPMIAPTAAPRPPPTAPPIMAPAAPPRIAPPTGSCAAASCIGIASAMARKAEAPKARCIVFFPRQRETHLSVRCVNKGAEPVRCGQVQQRWMSDWHGGSIYASYLYRLWRTAVLENDTL